MKKFPFALALLCTLSALASLNAETIKFGQTGKIAITPPKGWKIESEENAFGPDNHVVRLIADKSRKPGCTIVIAAGERQPLQTEGSFLAYAEDSYSKSADQFAEKTPSFKKLNIHNGIGYYCVARYAERMGKAPEKGTANVCGTVLIYRENSPLIHASLYVDDTKDPALDLMVKAICEMEVSLPPPPSDRVQFDNDRFVKIDIPPGWGTMRDNGNPLPGTDGTYDLKLTPPAGEKASLTISIGKLKPGTPPLSREQFNAMADQAAAPILSECVEKKAVYKDISVRGGQGLYCILTDASLVNKPPVPGDYKYAALLLAHYDNGCIAYATALTDDPGGANFQLMLKTFSGIEPSFATPDKTPPVQVRTNRQGVYIGNAGSKVKLLVPSNTSFKQKPVGKGAGGGLANPGYFFGSDSKTGVVLSGWFEPASKFGFKDAKQMWIGEGLDRADNVQYTTINDWDVILYEMVIAEAKFRQSHIRANYLRGDTWIDLHLSITDSSRSGKSLRNELIAYLKTLKIVNAATSPIIGTATIPFGENGSLKIDIPDTWQSRVAGEQSGTGAETAAAYTVALDAGTNTRFACKLSFLIAAQLPKRTKEQWRASFQQLGDERAKDSVEKKATLIPIDIKNGYGAYFILTDAALVGKAPPPGEYKIAAIFNLRYENGMMAIITVLMDDSDSTEFKQILKSISTMEPDLKILTKP